MKPQPNVLIVGASARAAAVSAWRAGYIVDAIDLFGDADLMEVCRRAISVPDLSPSSLEAALQQLAPCPSYQAWIPTGGLENQPDSWRLLNERFSNANHARNRLTPAATLLALEQLRSPEAWQAWASSAGLEFPSTLQQPPESLASTPPPNASESPAAERWLRKMRRGGGGLGIEPWTTLAQTSELDGASYWQKEVPGRDVSALAWSDVGHLNWIGSTLQWSGLAGCGAPAFWYSGSLGPYCLGEWREPVERFLRQAAEETRWTGWLGVDLRIDSDRAWVLEINPRYTAGAEVLERAAGKSLIGWSLQTTDETYPAFLPRASLPAGEGLAWGKMIWYLAAGRRLRVRDDSQAFWQSSGDPGMRPIADVGSRGLEVSGPAPAFSLFAQAPQDSATLETLFALGVHWETLIFEPI